MVTLANREKRVGLRMPVGVSGRDAAGEMFAEATQTLNVSGGGLCFVSARPLPIGARIDLRIQVPPGLRHHFGGRATYSVRAVVCRLEHLESEATYRVGVRFLGELEA